MMKIRKFTLLLPLLLLLTACADETDSLLRVPQLPEQYVLVQQQLDRILADGSQLAAPVSGQNRSAIQLNDLDGDGTDEVLVFCSAKEDDAYVPKMYLFRRETNRYVQAACVEGVGDSFDLCDYPAMGADGQKLLVIGWRLGANPVRGVTVHVYAGGTLTMLYNGEYTGLLAEDIDSDGDDDLLLLRHYASASTPGSAVLLEYERDALTVVGETILSAGIQSPESCVYDRIGADLYGVIIDAKLAGADRAGEAGMLTDLLYYADGQLYNLSYDETARRSDATYRPVSFPSRDIDRDGIVEVPRVEYLPGSTVRSAYPFLRVDWCVVDKSLTLSRKFTAYTAAGLPWYFKMPDALIPSVTLTRGVQDVGRDTVVFCEYNSETEQLGRALWQIVSLTGSDRYKQKEELGLFELARTSSALYGVMLNSERDIITYEEISRYFHLS